MAEVAATRNTVQGCCLLVRSRMLTLKGRSCASAVAALTRRPYFACFNHNQAIFVFYNQLICLHLN